MADYMLLFRGGNPKSAGLSAEQFQKHMQEWGGWVGSLHAKGIFKAGESLKPATKVVSPKLTVTDGPFPEAKEVVGGFVIISAENWDAAVETAKGCPVCKTGGSVEVRELEVMAR